MNLPPGMIAVAAALALLGLLLTLAGRFLRRRYGLGEGQTLALDNVLLVSRRLGLAGRPDRLVKRDGALIPEEWKSARVLRTQQRAQMGAYLLLVEAQFRQRPAYGVIVLGDGARHRIDNTEELRGWVLDLAARIRAARAEPERPVPVYPQPGQCRACGMRGQCSQARL